MIAESAPGRRRGFSRPPGAGSGRHQLQRSGLALAGIACLAGATACAKQGVLEVAGGRLAGSLRFLPRSMRFSAITFGHVVLGVSHSVLAEVRVHEHAHVRQYERWGVLFFPLYLGSSGAQLVRGGHPYHDNAFERQACQAEASGDKRPA